MALNWDFKVISSSTKHVIVIFVSLIVLSTRASCDDSLHAIKGSNCFESERRALIAIKSDMYDPGEWLSSWTGYDCCKWRGVACDNVTGYVTRLDLHYPYEYIPWMESIGASKVNASLFELKHLRYLDLSFNNFSYAHVPDMIASLVHLEYLNLSNTFSRGLISPLLGNLSHLKYLDLENCWSFTMLFTHDLSWLSNLNSLHYLDMSCVDLSKATNWLHQINLIPTLQVLLLRDASLPRVPHSLPTFNLTSLTILDLSGYEWAISASMLRWLSNASNLEHLDLSKCSRVFDFEGLAVALGALHNLRKLVLFGNKIAGEISTILKNVSRMLQYLDLRWNSLLSGEISTILSILPRRLEFLALHDNNIYGRIPEMLGDFTSLRHLSMSYTQITGDIPRTIGKLIHLEYLDLSKNHITGELPVNVGNLTNLVFLYLYENNITGSIPEGVSNFVSLEELDLSENNITGEIPKALGNLQNLVKLDLQANAINGQIPDTIGKISTLQYLDVSKNHLTGEIPKTIARISTLQHLDVSENHLTGEMPLKLGNLTNLVVLYLRGNNITGPIPESVGNLVSLEELDLSRNKITGEIPKSLGSLQNMLRLNLHANFLTGQIPTTIGRISNLDYLDVSENHLTGEIPKTIGIISTLRYLNASENHLTGQIPKTIGRISNLFQLDISKNHLTGEIPKAFGCLCNLGVLQLSLNNINGELTDLLDGLSNCSEGGMLSNLLIAGNNLSGRIPSSLLLLAHLAELDLSSNSLQGTIPANLSALIFLSHLNLSFNKLSGRVPTWNQFSTFNDPAIYTGNKDLCGWPLPECPSDGNGGKLEIVLDFAFVAMGFILGFWAYWGTMIMKKSVKIAVFQMADRIYDWSYVQLAVKFGR
ncbi:LRR receptor-like serine/threonine-protein kinase GSO2 isoform X1 [Zingiber officinale]|uniref:Leucine-rich repeat-containing N-terminal plant-type domain-containing protein n=1 Tax=Zingiber officinale TaxID=94328 RepID=A0A8J5FK05_ZINOF|nr:LRR receptor-like serine/threonine-protein kinase GSO2 isoform X1 [Zingiber officinale]KAG6489847.1 hypothetical protein ZIOFF_051128 [Zingiber officinale]